VHRRKIYVYVTHTCAIKVSYDEIIMMTMMMMMIIIIITMFGGSLLPQHGASSGCDGEKASSYGS
jgi:hypothetical protein